MALSMYASTEETTNTSRISRLLLDPCSDQLRDLLNHHVPHTTFPQVIQQQRMKLPRMTKPQMNLILPRSGHYSGNYSDFDISLLYLLLRNICNIKPHGKGWGNDPDPNDTSLSASIERIRNTRNRVVGHLNNSSLPYSDFNDIWSTVKTVVMDIDSFLNNNQKYEKEVDFLRNTTMDPLLTKQYEERLYDQIKEDTQTRKMASKTQEIVEGHQAKLKMLQRNRDEDQEHNIAKFAKLETDFQEHNTQILYLRQQLVKDKSDEEPDLKRLKHRLDVICDKETREIPLSAVQADGDQLPVEQLFSSVVIKEDVKDNHKKTKSAQCRYQQQGREVNSPEDMLTKNGKPVRRVFMLGKAAHGKTTYCKWLLKTWHNTQQPVLGGRLLSRWENALSTYDFVFYIPLRHVDPSRANVIDMICKDILGLDNDLSVTATHVLSSKKYKCFIMIDGLDEWKPDQSVIKQLKFKGMPNVEMMSNCVIFTTMRPWKFSEIEGGCYDDRVVEILGLDHNGIESVIEKVLIHFYQMKPDSFEYKSKRKEILSKLRNKTMESFIQIPLLAVVCVQLWYEGRQTRETMTSFYSELIDMLIERAFTKIKYEISETKEIKHPLPEALSENENIITHFSVLLMLGKAAYNGLLSKNDSLEFQKRKLERELGKENLQFALDVGLISQKEVRGITTKNVIVHFFHKSIQEYLAAIYIVTYKDLSDSFCKHLSDIKVIMELSNVILFACGMCPSLGSDISKHVVSVTDRDSDILKYRETPGYKDIVHDLYKEQVSWYRELHDGQTDCPLTDSPVTCHISDVFLLDTSDIETVSITSQLLADHNVDIRSLWLYHVPTDREHEISNDELNTFLCNKHQTRSLIKVYIHGGYITDRSLNMLCAQKLKYLRLVYVKIQDSDLPLLYGSDSLQEIYMRDMTLRNRDLGLTQRMSRIQDIKLHRVNMTDSGWGRLIQSSINIQHQFNVRLSNIKIDRQSILTVCSSSQLLVTRDGDDEKGRYELYFTRVWPLKHDPQ